jgi:hypothetical protein
LQHTLNLSVAMPVKNQAILKMHLRNYMLSIKLFRQNFNFGILRELFFAGKISGRLPLNNKYIFVLKKR